MKPPADASVRKLGFDLPRLMRSCSVATATAVTASPQLRSGRLKPLAVTSAKRVATFPDIPTTAEAGLPNYDASIWWAWAATAGTPPAVLARLNKEIASILQTPETAKRFAAESAEVEMSTPAEMKKFIPADLAKWEKVAKEAGMAKN